MKIIKFKVRNFFNTFRIFSEQFIKLEYFSQTQGCITLSMITTVNQTYISYIEDTHHILFGSANSFESNCVHMKSPRTYVHPDRQTDRHTYIRTDGRTDRQAEIFICLFGLLRHTNHEYL